MSFRRTKADSEPHSFVGAMQAYVILLWGKLSGVQVYKPTSLTLTNNITSYRHSQTLSMDLGYIFEGKCII